MDTLKQHIENKNYVAGIRQLEKLAGEGKIRHIYLAADADESFKKRVQKIAAAETVVTVTGSCKEFGQACGIRRIGCAVVGILK